MGRELKRKQAKREGKNVREVQKKKQEVENNSVTLNKLIILVICMILLFCTLYLVTGLFITKDIKWFSKNSSSTEEKNSVDNKILASEVLKQSEEEYYVYYYDPSDEDSSVSSIISSLNEEVYRVDLSSDFNSSYIGESSGIVERIEDLKVSNPTVIRVESGKIVEFYNGALEIEKLR